MCTLFHVTFSYHTTLSHTPACDLLQYRILSSTPLNIELLLPFPFTPHLKISLAYKLTQEKESTKKEAMKGFPCVAVLVIVLLLVPEVISVRHIGRPRSRMRLSLSRLNFFCSPCSIFYLFFKNSIVEK